MYQSLHLISFEMVYAPCQKNQEQWQTLQALPPYLSSLANVVNNLKLQLLLQLMHRSSRSEEHTSELQSRFDLVCRLLLEKKKKIFIKINYSYMLIISIYNYNSLLIL